MKKKQIPLKKKLLFTTILLFTILFVCEIATRLYNLSKGRLTTPSRSLQKEYTWAQEMLAKDSAEFNEIYRYDPYVGWRLRPNLRTEDLITNSAGMRNERDFTKESNGKRILFVGDSYTHGSHVKNNEVYTYYLQQIMPEWEILNMAVGSTATDQHLITFEQHGKQYNPQIVVLGFFVWDFYRNFTSFRGYAKPYFVVENGQVVLKKDHIIPPEELFKKYKTGERALPTWYESHLLNKMRYNWERYKQRSLHKNNDGFTILAYMMERFKKQVESTGATPFWLIIPNRDLMEKDYHFQPIIDFCKEKCQELNMHYFDLSETLVNALKKGKKIYRPSNIGGHFSALGHKTTAEALHEVLQSKGLLKGTK